MSDEAAAVMETFEAPAERGGMTEFAGGGTTEADRGLSVGQLAAQLAKGRDAGTSEKDDKKKNLSGEGEAKVVEKQTEGSATTETEPETQAQRLDALNLSAEQRTAIDKVLESGTGEIDPDALKLTDEQVKGLQEALESGEAKPAEEAATEESKDEDLDLSQVPKLSPEQGRHVGELFKTRLGKVIAKERGKAEAAIAAEKTAREAAEAKATALETKLKQAPASVSPVSQYDTPEKVEALAVNAKNVKKWAKEQQITLSRNPDAVAEELARSGIKLADDSPESMREWFDRTIMSADETLTELVPERREWLKQEANFNQAAEARFPAQWSGIAGEL